MVPNRVEVASGASIPNHVDGTVTNDLVGDPAVRTVRILHCGWIHGLATRLDMVDSVAR
jgi:hypothetical protein